MSQSIGGAERNTAVDPETGQVWRVWISHLILDWIGLVSELGGVEDAGLCGCGGWRGHVVQLSPSTALSPLIM